ncbi:hypothetical protein ACFE04_010965 [Oxalis oulophora]
MGEEVKQEQPPQSTEEKAPPAPEEKPAAAEEEEEKKQEPKPPAPFVLSVDLHCVGCAKKIERSIMKIRGVEGVVIDMSKNQVTIKGIVEPQAICNKIIKKTKRKAKVLSPLPEAEGQPMPEVITSQVNSPTTVELNVNMHCEACAQQLKKKILKMRGVQTVVTELSASKVTVTGTMDGDKLVEYVYRRTKKQARIVPQPEPEPAPEPEKKEEEKPPAPAEEAEKKEEKAEEKPAEEAKNEDKPAEEGEKLEESNNNNMMVNLEEENMKRMVQHYYQSVYMIERIPPPQLFSDENPNACCIT